MMWRRTCGELFSSPAPGSRRSVWLVSRFCTSLQTQDDNKPDRRQAKKAVKRILPSVVTVSISKGMSTDDSMSTRDLGGIIVDPLGYIVTSTEGIRSQRKEYLSKFKVDVHLNPGMPSEYTLPGKLSYADLVNKFAIVKCESEKPLHAAKLNHHHHLWSNHLLYLYTSCGHKNTLPNSIVADLVINFRREEYCPFPIGIAESCMFSSGIAQAYISGLAVVNFDGELVGIFNDIVNKLHFATSAKVVSKVLEILKKHGNCQPWIGAGFSPKNKHAIVNKVIPDSPAEDAGLRMGDRITHFDYSYVRSFVQLYNMSLLGLRRPLKARANFDCFKFAVVVPSVKEQAWTPLL